MAKPQNPFRRIRLVYKRSSPLLKCVVLSCIVLALVALLVIRGAILQVREEKEEQRAQAAQLEQENAKLKEDLTWMDTIDGIKRIAQEKLGLLPSGSEIITTAPTD